MKRSWILLVAILGLWSCNKQSDPASTCFIKGTVKSMTKEYLAFTYADFLDSAKIDQNREFSLEVPVQETGYGMLMYNNALVEVYLEAGKNLEININTKTFPEKIEFGGDLGPINHYLQLARKLDRQADISSEVLFKLEPESFQNYTDSIRLTKSKLLLEYEGKFPDIDKAFITKKEADILYTWASQQLLYPGYYALIKNQIPPLPEDYHNTYLEKLELNNASLLISPMYKTFLENYLDYREAVYIENNPKVQEVWFPGSVARFRVIHQEFTDQEVKNYLLYISMIDHLDNFGTEHVESFITNFRVSCTNEEYLSHIEEKFSSNEKLARGKIAPELEFFNREGEKVKLSDLKGKLLYINFWASWSEWSIQEFSYWENLRKDFDGYAISFISVSMDFVKDKNKWEYILNKQKLGGMHLMQDPKSTAFQDQYFINDLPRYLLIDKEGKIISAHAPSPSENMELTLKKLLKE